MKKAILYSMLLAGLGLYSCTDGFQQQTEQAATVTVETDGIVANVPAFIPAADTRIVWDAETYEFLSWTWKDRIGIYYQEGTEAAAAGFEFDNNSEAGIFVNKGFQLNPLSSYYALYPYREKGTAEKMELDFTNSTPYMFSKIETGVSDAAIANFEHLTSLVHFDLPVPVGQYYKLVITTNNSQELAAKSILNMKTGELTISEKTDSLVYGVGTGSITLSRLNTNIFLAPQDLSKAELTFHLYSTADEEVVLKATGVNFKRGYQYKVTASLETGHVSDVTIDQVREMEYSLLRCAEGHQWDMGTNSPANWIFGDVMGGDAGKGSRATDQPMISQLEQWQFTADNVTVQNKWANCYKGIKYANAMLLAVADKANRTLEQAEAYFLRAFYGFEAVKIFGAAVPYPTVADYQDSEEPLLTNTNSGGYVYAWDKIAADLQLAINGLPNQATENQPISKWAAKALLAKVYLYWSSPYNGKNGTANHWNDANAQLTDIINSDQFKLDDSYASLFMLEGNNSSENVFDIYHTTATGNWQDAVIASAHAIAPCFIPGSWGFFVPTYQFVNNFIVDSNGLPAEDYLKHEPLAKVDGTRAKSDLETFVDPRLDITAGRFEVPYFDWATPREYELLIYISEVNNSGLFLSKKYSPMKSEKNAISDCPAASNKSHHVIRYAEVLLMAAEVAIHNGQYAVAEGYINQIRSRAANKAWWVRNEDNKHKGYVGSQLVTENTAANYRIATYPAGTMNAANAQAMLDREIRLELGMEGQRWFNLTRWGIAKQELDAFAAFENQYRPIYQNSYNANWVSLPIPQAAIDESKGGITQNENWK